jgi:thiol-disulfide isomerase/thioredoxin
MPALTIGDAAPRLTIARFLKGTPFTAFQPNKVYVVEFWATWCGPCRQTMPHLTALQQKYKAVTILGVSVSEPDPAAVKPFVQQMGKQIGYAIATDNAQNTMGKNWLAASGQAGIPVAFVVNKEGRIAWIGNPLNLEAPLQQVLAGRWDIRKAAAQYRIEQAQATRKRTLQRQLEGAKTPQQALTALNAALNGDTTLEREFGIPKMSALAASGKTAEALAYGKRLTEVVYARDSIWLIRLASALVGEEKNTPPAFAQVALRAALRADQLSGGKEAVIADVLAASYFATGNPKQAYVTQQRVAALLKGTPYARDPKLAERLAKYKKAAGR